MHECGTFQGLWGKHGHQILDGLQASFPPSSRVHVSCSYTLEKIFSVSINRKKSLTFMDNNISVLRLKFSYKTMGEAVLCRVVAQIRPHRRQTSRGFCHQKLWMVPKKPLHAILISRYPVWCGISFCLSAFLKQTSHPCRNKQLRMCALRSECVVEQER